jgi:DNA ligase D-like protein (predicted 3'-phosphoesterase)
MALEKYNKKRKFDKTPEPKGKVTKKDEQRFVVQEHHARALHYDFRLEIDGVLRSWAIPKVPPRKTGIRRLAMSVENHPVSYVSFSGVIPKGNYGAGRVIIWDKGGFDLKKNEKNEILFNLNGLKLKGKYALIKPKDSRFGSKAWLFFKRK